MPLDLCVHDTGRGVVGVDNLAWERGMVVDVLEDVTGYAGVMRQESAFLVVRVPNWRERADAAHLLEWWFPGDDETQQPIKYRKIMLDIDALKLTHPGDKLRPINSNQLEDFYIDTQNYQPVMLATPRGRR